MIFFCFNKENTWKRRIKGIFAGGQDQGYDRFFSFPNHETLKNNPFYFEVESLAWLKTESMGKAEVFRC